MARDFSRALPRALPAVILLLLGCSDKSSPGDPSPDPIGDVVVHYDSVPPPPPGDAVTPDPREDSAAPSADSETGAPPPPADSLGPRPDPPPPLGVEPGSLEYGEPCNLDEECASGLCWRSSEVTGCTIPCTSDEPCAVDGLQCSPIGAETLVCGPPRMIEDPGCATHGQCRYPYTCRDDMGWCEVPECRFETDCPPGATGAERRCNLDSRRCEPLVCTSTHECTSPVEFCVAGSCGPPQCTERSDCAPGEVCDKVQGRCHAAQECSPEDENPCEGFYNLVCIDGLCEVNRCPTACFDDEGQRIEDEECPPCENPNAQCDQATGHCRLPCENDDQCLLGEVCERAAGLCFINHPPVARAYAMAPEGLAAAVDIEWSAPIALDGSQSFDPEGMALDYHWYMVDFPPESSFEKLESLPDSDGPNTYLVPDALGTFVVGLYVEDPNGFISKTTEVVVRVH